MIISLKCDLRLLPHPPLFLDGSIILETSTVRVLGFTFDSLLTWEPHIVSILNRENRGLASSILLLLFAYKSRLIPALEYGSILYAGAASTHLQRLDRLQSRIEQTCSSHFQSLLHRRNASIIGLVCRLLAGEGRGNL